MDRLGRPIASPVASPVRFDVRRCGVAMFFAATRLQNRTLPCTFPFLSPPPPQNHTHIPHLSSAFSSCAMTHVASGKRRPDLAGGARVPRKGADHTRSAQALDFVMDRRREERQDQVRRSDARKARHLHAALDIERSMEQVCN